MTQNIKYPQQTEMQYICNQMYLTLSLSDSPSTTRIYIIEIAAEMIVLINLFLFIGHLPPLSLGIQMYVIIICFDLSAGANSKGESDSFRNE